MIVDCFEDFTLRILIVATIVSLITGYIQDGLIGLVDGLSILIAIIIIVAVTVTNESIKQKQFAELQEKSSVTTAIVVRNGE